jgi:hypothetical protein
MGDWEDGDDGVDAGSADERGVAVWGSVGPGPMGDGCADLIGVNGVGDDV